MSTRPRTHSLPFGTLKVADEVEVAIDAIIRFS